jgi:hypothetical protein
MTTAEVLTKHNYQKLNKKQAESSLADYQHRSAYDMNERWALTLVLNRNQTWILRDHRGDICREGRGAEELDGYLVKFHADDE